MVILRDPGSEGGGGESLEQRLTTAAGPEPVSAAPVAQPASPAAPAAPAQPAASAAAPATPAEWQGVTDFARAQGVELPWKDDVQALQNLISAYRQQGQRNFYADLGRQVAPHADQIRAMIQQQQAQQQAPPSRPWAAPSFKREWLSQVETDPETGQLRARPGYDPSLPEKVQAYAEWLNKFQSKPDEFLDPWVEAKATAIVEQRMAGYQEQQDASRLVSQEAQWIFQGGRVGGPLTVAGQMYGRAANQFYQAGLRDVRSLHAAAVAVVQNAFLRQQAQASGQAQAAAQAAPAVAAGNPVSVAQALARGLPPGKSAVREDPEPQMSLHARLMKRLQAVPE